MFSLGKNHESRGGHPLGGIRAIADLLAGCLLGAAFCSVLLFSDLPAWGADNNIRTITDTVTFLQQRISEDIAKPRTAVEAELRDFPLGSADVRQRIKQLADLTTSASEDVTRWGYTDGERERYTQLLSTTDRKSVV